MCLELDASDNIRGLIRSKFKFKPKLGLKFPRQEISCSLLGCDALWIYSWPRMFLHQIFSAEDVSSIFLRNVGTHSYTRRQNPEAHNRQKWICSINSVRELETRFNQIFLYTVDLWRCTTREPSFDGHAWLNISTDVLSNRGSSFLIHLTLTPLYHPPGRKRFVELTLQNKPPLASGVAHINKDEILRCVSQFYWSLKLGFIVAVEWGTRSNVW
jgi:hypothetical protein